MLCELAIVAAGVVDKVEGRLQELVTDRGNHLIDGPTFLAAVAASPPRGVHAGGEEIAPHLANLRVSVGFGADAPGLGSGELLVRLCVRGSE